MLHDLRFQIVIHNIFKIHKLKLVSPWMEDREALMLHLLLPEPHDVLLDEQEIGLVSLDGVPQVVLLNWLFRVSKVRGQYPDA